MLDRALDKYGVTTEYLKQVGKSASDYRFQTKEEWEEWRAWCIERIMKVLKMDQQTAEMEFDIFDLSMGLHHNFH